jgi:putative ABC transport system permease protein
MRYLAVIKIAFRALRRNKMRTVLTMLGIIIGVGAVIAMVALGRGAKAQVEARIAALGQNVIQIFSGSVNRGGVFSGFGGAGTLTKFPTWWPSARKSAAARKSRTAKTTGALRSWARAWTT